MALRDIPKPVPYHQVTLYKQHRFQTTNMLDHPEIARGTPGAIGALAAMLWLKDTVVRRLSAVIAGSAASYYGTPFALLFFATVDSHLMGFLIGLFGMAVASKLLETLEAIPAKVIIDKLVSKMGL